MSDFLEIDDELWKGKDLGQDVAGFDRVFKEIAAFQSVHSKAALNIYNTARLLIV